MLRRLMLAGGAYPTLTLTGTYAAATIGTAYSSDLTISGGNGSYSNARLTSGSLSGTGLSLSIVGSALRLSGTPTGSAGTLSITVAVDSGDGQTATSPQSIVVSSATSSAVWDQTSAVNCTFTTTKKYAATSFGSYGNAVTDTSISGKTYFEVTLGNSASTVNNAVGISDLTSLTTSRYVGDSTSSVGIWPGGSNGVFYNTSKIFTPGLSLGSVRVGVAVDGRKVWIRANGGAWYGGGDPALGTSPTATLSGTSALRVMGTSRNPNTASGDYITLCSAPSEITGTPPSGFSNGF